MDRKEWRLPAFTATGCTYWSRFNPSRPSLNQGAVLKLDAYGSIFVARSGVRRGL